MTSSGERKPISEVKIGELLLAMNPDDGQLFFSPVLLFLDKDPKRKRQFYKIRTESGKSLTLTPTHLIFASSSNNQDEFTAKYASDVREGDFVLVSEAVKGEATPEAVVSIEVAIEAGAFAPLTSAGNLVVDGVVASCYAVVDSQSVAHAAFAPWRWRYAVLGNDIDDYEEGVHWYADWLYKVAAFIMPDRLR